MFMSLQLENGTTENLELKTEKRLVSKPAGFILYIIGIGRLPEGCVKQKRM